MTTFDLDLSKYNLGWSDETSSTRSSPRRG